MLVQSMMPILFFLSPVVFKAEVLGDMAWVMILNPLTAPLVCIRDSLLGVVPDVQFVYAQLFYYVPML